MYYRLAAGMLALLFLVTGCAVNPDTGRVGSDPNVINKQNVLSVGGGILGAVICNQLFDGHGSRDGWTAACGIGGYFLSQSFLQKSNVVLEQNKTGQTSQWVDPDGKHVSLTPTRTYYQGDLPCREYRSVVEINGEQEIATGIACRQADGSWQIQN